ncbi:YrrS family protein [Bacillus sp. CHD6a]|uniref:YrrS family protein n=1 Tax=Bacillus sp. CHD6a TaxID=1643452 RepID=UPI0007611030|nr:YrrS family protein [Bacillus sp. CHD6a]
MSLDFNKGGSRYGRTTKRKKTNMILNILIGVVFIFIIVLASSLFFGKNDPATDNENQLATGEQELSETEENETEQESEEAAPTDEEEAEAETEEAEESAEKEKEKEDKEKDEESEEADDSETEVSENSDDPNVIKTMTNPGWGPVGTSQSEPHTSVYEEGHVDWNEKLKAVEAATRMKSGEYTLYFLGNGGSEHLSVASIKNKSTGENFKIYLEWVTNKGWKPTKVEQVKAL